MEALTLKAFNRTHTIGAAHFERAVIFDCDEDCFVSVYAGTAGAPGATLQIVLSDRATQVPGQPTPRIVEAEVDLSTASRKLAASLAFRTGSVLEARSFGVEEVEVAFSAVTGPAGAPTPTPVR